MNPIPDDNSMSEHEDLDDLVKTLNDHVPVKIIISPEA